MKELFFQKRQNTELRQENFIWQKSTASSYPDDCVPCKKKDKPINNERPCGGKLHPCVSKEQNEHANWTAKNLKSLSAEIMSDKNHAAVRLNSQNAKDGLGAVVLGLMKELGIKGCLNYGLPVLYRSGKLTTQRRAAWMAKKGNCFPIPGDMPPALRSPNVGEGTEAQLKDEKAFRLSGVNAIYPGQIVTLVKENGRLLVIVSDTNPYDPGTVTVTPGGGGKRKKKEECVECKDGLSEAMFGYGTMQERVDDTYTAGDIFAKDLEAYRTQLEALNGKKGVITMMTKILSPIFSGGVLGWTKEAIDGKRNDMVKELTKKKNGYTKEEAERFVDSIVTSMQNKLPEAQTVAKNVVAHYEELGIKPKNKNMLVRDIATYVGGTLIAGGLVATGIVSAPLLSILTASIVLTNIRTPFVKKLAVLPDVNSTLNAIAAAKGGAAIKKYVDRSYTDQIQKTIESGQVYDKHLKNFVKFKEAILGGNDKVANITGKLTATQREKYLKKQEHYERLLPQLEKNVTNLGLAITNKKKGERQGIAEISLGKANSARLDSFNGLERLFERDARETKRMIKVLKGTRSVDDRRGTSTNEEKIKAGKKILTLLVEEYNEQFSKTNRDDQRYGNSEIRIENGQIVAYEDGSSIPSPQNFTKGKDIPERKGRLESIRELHRMVTTMDELNKVYVELYQTREIMRKDEGESGIDNVYQGAAYGFLEHFSSFSSFHNMSDIVVGGEVVNYMDHFQMNAPVSADLQSKYGVQTYKDLLRLYYASPKTSTGSKRKAILNDLVDQPRFRDYLHCLGKVAAKCEETGIYKEWRAGVDKNAVVYANGVPLEIASTGVVKQRFAITWGMVEGLWKALRPKKSTTPVFEDRVRYTDTRKDGGILNEDVPIGSDYDQTMQWAMNNNPNIARELYQVQTGTITNTVSRTGEAIVSGSGGIVGPGVGAIVNNKWEKRQGNTEK